MCVFCEIARGGSPAHIVLQDDVVTAFLDLRPVFPGHVLVVPRDHHETLTDLPDELIEPFFKRVRLLAGAVQSAMGAEGTFVAMNNKVSQSVPHLHAHIVPRKRKDGLRGFFWPRKRYSGDDEMSAVAERIRMAVDTHG